MEFNKEDPKLSEYEAKIKHYEELEVEINGLPEFYDVGPIALYTGRKPKALTIQLLIFSGVNYLFIKVAY